MPTQRHLRAVSPRALLLAAHPLPTAAVSTVSVILAVGVGLGAARVVLVGLAVLTGQLSIGWSNDCLDAARDAAAARRDKPAASGRVAPGAVAVAAGAALVLTVVLSVVLAVVAGAATAVALLVLVAAGWAYNLGLKATVWSGITYLIGFGALGAAPYLAKPGQPWPPWWAPVTGALLGLAAHVANVLPDLRDDAVTGVRGLPHRLGARVSTVLMGAVLAAASIVLALGPPRPAAVAVSAIVLGTGVSVAVAAVALRAPGRPAAFRLIMVLAVLDVALLVGLAG